MTSREEFKAELVRRCERGKRASTLDQLRAQWRVHGWDDAPVVIEAFGEEKLLATTHSPEGALTLIDQCVVGAYYVHLHEVSALKATPWSARWQKQSGKRGISVDDDDICTLRVLPIDVDPVRATGKGDNASADEQRAAFAVAARIYLDLAEILGRDDCLSLLSSGNGWWVLVSLDSLPVSCRGLIVRALTAVKAIYACPTVELDTSVSDPRRIGPLAATWKRKAKQTAERPHRLTWIAAPAEVARIDEDTLAHLVTTLESRIPEGTPVEVPGFRGSVATVASDTDNAFARCDQVRIGQVVAHFDDPRAPTCPVCGAHGTRGNTSVCVLDDEQWNHFDCKHATCGSWKAGPVYYVAYQLCGVREIRGNREAARMVLDWFAEKFGVQVEPPTVQVSSEPGMHVDDDEDEKVRALVVGATDDISVVDTQRARFTRTKVDLKKFRKI